ncbi:glycosyltransferase family 4 protein [bacterium]|nr:glycosyltransferase family 4 protein [bacterium]
MEMNSHFSEPISKSRILFLEQSLTHGGGARSLFYILRFLDKEQFEAFIAVPEKEGLLNTRVQEEKLATILYEPHLRIGMTSHQARGFLRWIKPVLQVRDFIAVSFFYLPSLIRKHHIALIHANTTATRFIGTIAGWVTKIPVIWHLRNVPDGLSRVGIAFFSRWSSLKSVIAVSEHTAKLFPVPSHKKNVVYNSIDFDEFDPTRIRSRLREEYHIPLTAFVVGACGRPLPKKGYHVLITAVAEMIRQFPEKDIRCVIVGGQNSSKQQAYDASLHAQVHSLALIDRVIFIGFKSDVRPYVCGMDVLAIPSLWDEPFGRTALEAMALQVPVIGFRRGGIPEVIGDEGNGLIVESGDVKGLANAMIRLMNNPQERAAMAQSARRRAVTHFDAFTKTRAIEDIFKLAMQ